MKKVCINQLLKLIRKYCPDYDQDQMDIIQYGLESLYIFITKIVFLTVVAIALNMLKEYVIFMIFFTIIRTTAFGLHATKSWICYVASTFSLVFVPWLCTLFEMHIVLKLLLGLGCIYYINKYAPADTENRPIVSMKRRKVFRYLSTSTAIIFVIFSLFMPHFIANSLIFAMVIECFMISPAIYKIFNMPYANYKTYLQMES